MQKSCYYTVLWCNGDSSMAKILEKKKKEAAGMAKKKKKEITDTLNKKKKKLFKF